MYPAKNISMVKGPFFDEESRTTENTSKTLFALIVELANLGVTLKISEDMGDHTLTVLYSATESYTRAGKVLDEEDSLQHHFHSGFPGCSEHEGENSLKAYLQDLVRKITEERS